MKNKTKAYEKKLSQLSYAQRCHFAWRLEARGSFGMGAAGHAVRGDWGDLTLLEIGRKAFNSDHAAKIHAAKTVNFVPNQEHLSMIESSPFTARNVALEIKNGIA